MLVRASKAVLQVVMDQSSLGGTDRPFDSMQLLNDLCARSMFFNQADHIAQMPSRPLETIDHLWMAGVDMIVGHIGILPGGYGVRSQIGTHHWKFLHG